MRVLHVYNQAQTFHLSGQKVDQVIRTEGEDCIFAWLSEDLLDRFNQRYGAFASFIVNGEETSLFLNLDGELVPSIIRYIQTGELHVHPQETQAILSLASVLGFTSIVNKISFSIHREVAPFSETFISTITKGINKDSAKEVWDQFAEDHLDYLVHMTSYGYLDPLMSLMAALNKSTEEEH